MVLVANISLPKSLLKNIELVEFLLKSLSETKNESMNFCVFSVAENYEVDQWFLWPKKLPQLPGQ